MSADLFGSQITYPTLHAEHLSQYLINDTLKDLLEWILLNALLTDTKINTTTSRENGANGIMPSSPGQMELAKLLAAELEALGMENIEVRDTAIVTATLPANTDDTIPVVSFLVIWIPVRGDRRQTPKHSACIITAGIYA